MTPTSRILRAYYKAGCDLDFNPTESAYPLVSKAEWDRVINKYSTWREVNPFQKNFALQFAAYATRIFEGRIGGIGIALDTEWHNAYNLIFYLRGRGVKLEAFDPQTSRFLKVGDSVPGQSGMMLLF